MKSVVSNERKCWVCGRSEPLHKHHIYYGNANRRLSEKYGCWVWLCPEHHNMSKWGVHFNKSLDLELKELCQMKLGWSPEKMIKVFGRNYL